MEIIKMKKQLMTTALVLFGLITANLNAQDILTVENTKPVVIKTFPQAGATAVDPSIKQIRVTFSKDMMTNQMWSWVIASQDTFPKITGNVKYLNDKRTCVAPVSLKPGKTYAIWFNSQKYTNFKDTGRRSAVPYLLVFKTRE